MEVETVVTQWNAKGRRELNYGRVALRIESKDTDSKQHFRMEKDMRSLEVVPSWGPLLCQLIFDLQITYSI